MKKFLLKMFAILAPVFALVSCSKDDPALAPTIEGTYPVNIYIGIASEPDMETPYSGSVIITATADNTVSLSLDGFSMGGGANIPIAVSGIETSGSEGNVYVSYAGPVESDALAALGSVSTTLSGTVTGGKLNFSLPVTVTLTAGGSLPVNVLLQSKEN